MRNRLVLSLAAALLIAPATYAQFAATGTTTVSVTVGPEAALTVNTAATTLATTGTLFSPYTGTTNLIYRIRTMTGTGVGSITLQVTSDFPASQTGGPSVKTPPTAGDALTYTCTNDLSGVACSGTQTATMAPGSTPVALFGPGANSTSAGNNASTIWSLTNDPVYKTGSYSATVLYTISAVS